MVEGVNILRRINSKEGVEIPQAFHAGEGSLVAGVFYVVTAHEVDRPSRRPRQLLRFTRPAQEHRKQSSRRPLGN